MCIRDRAVALAFGSTGTLVPPKGYLQKLREICDKHGILLIFDEVITGWGRTGSTFASQEFDVTPDIITLAKATTNGVVPMGVVACNDSIYDAVMDASPTGAVELFHGYTYSGIPVAVAAALACLLYTSPSPRDGLLSRMPSSA